MTQKEIEKRFPSIEKLSVKSFSAKRAIHHLCMERPFYWSAEVLEMDIHPFLIDIHSCKNSHDLIAFRSGLRHIEKMKYSDYVIIKSDDECFFSIRDLINLVSEEIKIKEEKEKAQKNLMINSLKSLSSSFETEVDPEIFDDLCYSTENIYI